MKLSTISIVSLALLGCSSPPTQATPPKTDVYAQILSKEQNPPGGAVVYSAFFGVGLPGTSKIIKLQNPNLFGLSVIGQNAPNTDCWTSKSVILGGQQTTMTADMTTLYGSSTPSTPVLLRACADQGVNGAYISITYQHP